MGPATLTGYPPFVWKMRHACAMDQREPIVAYLAAALTLAAAGGSAIKGAIAPAVVLALGALFLIYWGRRLDRQRGER
jgi:hypothetical protein